MNNSGTCNTESNVGKRPLMPWLTSLWLLLAASIGTANAAAPSAREAAMAAAQASLSPQLLSKVRNLDPTFHWISDSDRFWFKRETATGDEFVVVNAATGRQSPAFDPAALTAALKAAGRTWDAASGLHITDLTFDPSGAKLQVDTPEGIFDCDQSRTRCQTHAAPPPADFVVSPDGKRLIFRRDSNLWLRDVAGGPEKQLTTDGEANFGYGDIDTYGDFTRVDRRRAGQPDPLLGVLWSPDGRWVVALRQDLRPYPERLLVTEYLPPDGNFTVTHSARAPIASDPNRPASSLIAIDTSTFAVHPIALDPQALNDYALQFFTNRMVWWSSDDHRLFLITANRGGTRYGFNSLDLVTGQTREILHENAQFNVRLNPYDYARPNVHVFAKGDEMLWYSERSGNGHLYLYDTATGKLKRPVTSGDWVVFDLLRVDEARRSAYFTGGPRNAGANPYYAYLYRVSLDGGEPKLLTPEVADHEFQNGGPVNWVKPAGIASGSSIAPSGRYFVDSYSTTDQPTTIVIRKISGELVAKVLTSDASALNATGWHPPQRVVAKAADGVTDLYGVMFRPRNFDASQKYPVIDYMYPGPQTHDGPLLFRDNFGGAQAFADAGFVVVTVDGRGSAYRSRAFRDAYLGTEDVFGAADHAAALKDLGSQFPYLDLDRVGVMGHSYGGFGSLRAMLLFPDLFKVAVSTVGPAKWIDFHQAFSTERFFGVAGASAEARAHYDLVDNIHLIPRLKGKVFLIYGGRDENVPLKYGLEVIDAFIAADRDFDMLLVPDSPHGAGTEPYALKRSLEYFIDHLTAPTVP